MPCRNRKTEKRNFKVSSQLYGLFRIRRMNPKLIISWLHLTAEGGNFDSWVNKPVKWTKNKSLNRLIEHGSNDHLTEKGG